MNIPVSQKAAVVWCILNRVDHRHFPDTIDKVITSSQFHGYDPSNPIDNELVAITKDVLLRWELERVGIGYVGRTLPKDYLYFASSTGVNRFRKHYNSTEYWDWILLDPYFK